jgi:hypothetical protein
MENVYSLCGKKILTQVWNAPHWQDFWENMHVHLAEMTRQNFTNTPPPPQESSASNTPDPNMPCFVNLLH